MSICYCSLIPDPTSGVWVTGTEPTSTEAVTLTKLIMPEIKIVNVKASYQACLMVDDRGQVWLWGQLYWFNQLGHKVLLTYDVPTILTGLPPVRTILAVSEVLDGLITQDGRFLINQNAPEFLTLNLPSVHSAVFESIMAGINYQNKVWLRKDLGDEIAKILMIGNLPPIIQLAACHYNLLMLANYGDLWEVTFSKNSESESIQDLHLEDVRPQKIMTDVVTVAADVFTSVAITHSGQAYRWEYYPPHMISQPEVILGLPPVQDVILNAETMIFLTTNGEFWGLGSSTHGQLGLVDDHGQPSRIILDEPRRLPMSDVIPRSQPVKSTHRLS